MAESLGDLTDRLVDALDLDGLLRHVDTLGDAGAWEELRRLRDRSRDAAELDRQLDAVAVHAEYRLALLAPADIAASVVEDATGRISIGPLAEVAASVRRWDELAPHLHGPSRALVAYERVARGDDLQWDRSIDTSVYDLPLVLEPWEPAYPVATYEAWRGIFPPPRPLPALRPVALPADVRPYGDPTATEALLELVRPWTTESNGRADAVAVQGDHLDAIAALGMPFARVGRIATDHALELMAWTAASGGAHGRRRGMGVGRFSAWWTVAALAGLADDWPVEPEDLEPALADLTFFVWDTGEEDVAAWTFRFAAVDPSTGMAWAIDARDERSDA